MSANIDTFPADAALLAAERERREIQAEIDRVADVPDLKDPLFERFFELDELVANTVPRTLAGAAAKLRCLLEREGLDFGDRDSNVLLLRQVIELIEAEARS